MNLITMSSTRSAVGPLPVRALLTLAVLTTSVTILAGAAAADTTPVGPFPKGFTTTVVAHPGSLVAVALPGQRPSSGLVWRLARPVDPTILRQVSEADVGQTVVIVFRAIGGGAAKVAFALTRGESGSTAIRAAIYSVSVK